MNEGLVRFNLTADNPFWSLLQEAHKAHITARERHCDLLELCKSKGVAFQDIEKHLLNEAKRCGLYRKTKASLSTKVAYPSRSDLSKSKVAWFVALENFLRWKMRNYRDYDVRSDKPIVTKQKPKEINVVRKTTDSKGNVTETKHKIVGASKADLKEIAAIESGKSATAPEKSHDMLGKVEHDLTPLQLQVLIIRNIGILGDMAEEKGAVKEWNALCEALGLIEEIRKEDEFIESVDDALAALQ